MTTEEIHQKLEKGYNDIAAGRVQNAAEAFAKFRENPYCGIGAGTEQRDETAVGR